MHKLALIIAAAVAFGLAEPLTDAADPSISNPLDHVQVLEIGPRTVPCDDVVPRRCFEARPAGEAAWRTFDATIDGYRHRDGYAAVLLVRSAVDASSSVGEDGGPERYELLRSLAELPLGGARWTLDRYGEVAAMVDPLPFIDVGFVVTAGGTHVEGTAGCNTFRGPLAIDDEEVRIGPLVTTRRSCDDEVMVQEAAILAALQQASRITFYRDAVAFAGDELRVRFFANLTEARLTWTQGPEDPELQRFNAEVREAAAAGTSWPRDPIRVALALIDSRGAPRVDIARRDDRAEAPSSTIVRIEEDGFLDDSVRGVRTEVVLAPADDGAWSVLAITVATRCWRGDRDVVAPGETCP